ncbi:hypothetical protein SAMN04488095_0892 [Jannaschia pohangensis]|uniref:Sulphur transport domain-containing protein n=2 Tax=Jannaschia pohangensis TaxID=390807 RepID=A0A1I3IBD8_9RHOB|nr:hypothetical protein SAMN04488095_0892 [Jannaschia pohangensis]
MLVSALSGALFGLGLLVSGMTDTDRVQGFLALLGPGAWDPTLAFVMGAGLIPMAVAWRITGKPLLGPAWPAAPRGIDAPLLGGAVLFGMGWGLVGLCPGPALAALFWGGAEVVVFTLAMAAGMLALPYLRRITR